MITLSVKSEEQFSLFASENKDVFYKFILKKIINAVLENKKSAGLFKFENGRTAFIAKRDYMLALNAAMTYFISVEDYESSARCRDIVNKLKVEDVIFQSSQPQMEKL